MASLILRRADCSFIIYQFPESSKLLNKVFQIIRLSLAKSKDAKENAEEAPTLPTPTNILLDMKEFENADE